ncbi:MAG: hypothetical protein ABH834_07155 [Candidatus Altiarchaeota archaeon]
MIESEKKIITYFLVAFVLGSIVSLTVSPDNKRLVEIAETISYSEKSFVRSQYALMGLFRGAVIGLMVGAALTMFQARRMEKAKILAISLVILSISMSFYEGFRSKDEANYATSDGFADELKWSAFYGLVTALLFAVVLDLELDYARYFIVISVLGCALAGLIARILPLTAELTYPVRYVLWGASLAVAFSLKKPLLRPINYKLVILPAIGFGVGRKLVDLILYTVIQKTPFMPESIVKLIFKTNLNFRYFITTPDFILYGLGIGMFGGIFLYVIVPWRQKRIISFCAIGFLVGLIVQYYGRYLAYANPGSDWGLIGDLSLGLIIGFFVGTAVGLNSKDKWFIMAFSALGFYFIRFLFVMKFPLVYLFWENVGWNNFFLYGFGGLTLGFALNMLILHILHYTAESTAETVEEKDGETENKKRIVQEQTSVSERYNNAQESGREELYTPRDDTLVQQEPNTIDSPENPQIRGEDKL